MNSTGLVLFVIFSLVLFGTYIAIRRRILAPTLVAAGSIIASIAIMTLVGMSQGNHIYQALFVGFLVGGLFSISVLAVAWFFASSERRQHEADAVYRPPTEG